MSLLARWSLLVAFALFACSSSSVNDAQGSGGGGSAGDAGNIGGSAGSISGGAAGQAGAAGTAGSGGGPTCAGDALQCLTCCETADPVAYAAFLDEFESSQCGAEACSGTCGRICSGSSEPVGQSCAECLFLNDPSVNEQIALACKLAGQDECQAFVSCLEACDLE
jgi:hypothetical protein